MPKPSPLSWLRLPLLLALVLGALIAATPGAADTGLTDAPPPQPPEASAPPETPPPPSTSACQDTGSHRFG